MWVLSRDIVLAAEHIPGLTNSVADAKSKSQMVRTDWKLHPELFAQINKEWGPLELDLHCIPRSGVT